LRETAYYGSSKFVLYMKYQYVEIKGMKSDELVVPWDRHKINKTF
jgi:hypothetical protein